MNQCPSLNSLDSFWSCRSLQELSVNSSPTVSGTRKPQPPTKKTAKKPLKKTASVSKYFQVLKHQTNSIMSFSCPEKPVTEKTKCLKALNNSSSDDDFRSPIVVKKRKDLAWKLGKEVKPKPPKSKRSTGKRKPFKNPTLEIIKSNFDCGSGENPEHLQMAIALSKSAYEAEYGQDCKSEALKEDTPDIAEILQNVKPVSLEKFGFKSDKAPVLTGDVRKRQTAVEASKNSKSRFKYITPILNIRTESERKSLIESKIAEILKQAPPTPKKPFQCSLFSSKLEMFLPLNKSIFKVDLLYENNNFYTDDLCITKEVYKCGSLLKDWGSILGRDKSPERSCVSEKNKPSADDEKHIIDIRASRKSPIKDCSKDLKSSSKSWMSDTKDSGISCGTFQSVSSFTFSYRSISPDLFGSDDEEPEANVQNENPLEDHDDDINIAVVNEENDSSTTEDKIKTIDLTDDSIEFHSKSNNSSTAKLASFYSLDDFEENDDEVKITSHDNALDDKEIKRIDPEVKKNLEELRFALTQKYSSKSDEEMLKNDCIKDSITESPGSHDQLINIEGPEDDFFDSDEEIRIKSSTNTASFKKITSETCGNFSKEDCSSPIKNDLPPDSPEIDRHAEGIIQYSDYDSSSSDFVLEFDRENSTEVVDNKIESQETHDDENISSKRFFDYLSGETEVSFSIKTDICAVNEKTETESKIADRKLSASSKSTISDMKCNESAEEITHEDAECIEILDDSHFEENFTTVPTHSPVFDCHVLNCDNYQAEDNEALNKDNPKLEGCKNSFEDEIYNTTISPINNSIVDNHDTFDCLEVNERLKEDSPKLERSNSPFELLQDDIYGAATPKLSKALVIDENPQVFNSADLNVTDYVNNLLNQEEFSFDKEAVEKEDLCSSQSSQDCLVVDEELNYSNHFSTPVRPKKFPRKHVKGLSMIAEDKLSQEEIKISDNPQTLPLKEPESSKANCEIPIQKASISTPANYIIKTKNVTPMPDFDTMTTPLVKKELEKLGVKPLKRARGTELLKYIYESTHPLAGTVQLAEKTDSEDDERIIKRRRKNTSSKVLCDSSNSNRAVGCEQISTPVDIVGNALIENENLEDLIFERKRSVRIPSCPVPLQIVWHNFLSCNPDIKENILLYEPIQLETLHTMLKETGFNFHIQDLLTFLDKKCITIRTAQKQGKRHR